MDFGAEIAAGGGVAGSGIALLFYFVKRYMTFNDKRHETCEATMTDMVGDLKLIRSDMGSIKVNVAKVSTAVDILLMREVKKPIDS